MRTQERRRGKLKQWFLLCPARHIVLLLSILGLALFYALRNQRELVNAFVQGIVRPYHRFLGMVTNIFPFSLAEWLYAALGALVLVYIIYTVVQMIRKKGRWARLYKVLLSLLTAGLVIFSGYSLLWSSLYYADSFAERAGIGVKPVSAQELYDTTVYYAGIVNAASGKVQRDANGVFDASVQDIFAAAPGIYANAVEIFPVLAGRDLRPKPMVFSKLMSEINFTGFFFPFTGEANLNIDAPRAFLPATVAHELAHQRGVAAEDEANFVAVIAGTKSGNDMYVYSSALLAYNELANALYGADQELYYKVAGTLNASVIADLSANGAYWAQFQTKAAAVSAAVYGNFLQSNGQELGMKSYGACVDLLVAWYEAGK
ncbi:MAG: DUF3810 domain-containing protein [Firmicutes bacterium]|nr:DUF3810 domain-containing protein [Bacillota bacterium]